MILFLTDYCNIIIKMKTAESKKITSAATTAAKKTTSAFFSQEAQGASAFFGGEKAEALPFFSPRTIQPKLTIGAPNDHYEQQADAVADQVVAKLNAPSPSVPPTPKGSNAVQAKCDHCAQEEKLQKKDEDFGKANEQVQMKPIFDSAAEQPPEGVQRKCADCAKEEAVQRKTDVLPSGVGGTEGVASSDLSSRLSASKGGGQPLLADTRSSMESAMGADFSNVRVHTGSEAVQMSEGINAQAFTHGSDVYFNEGKYDTGSSSGKHLLAHELTHTVQQGGAVQMQIHKQQTPRTSIQQPTTTQQPKCGPDSTNWFVNTVNNALVDPRVLSIKTLLSRANLILSIGGVGSNTSRIAEAGSTAAISAQLLNLGSVAPGLNSTIIRQLARGTASSVLVATETTNPSKLPAILMATSMIGIAANQWKNLVNHGAPFDFKAHIMNHPHTPHCPDEGCVSRETGVITLCPGFALENCYESDITGNIFYALIGKFIGWSKLTLQLGSQLAELTDTRVTPIHPTVTWDTPDDTFGINLGFGLPLPLTNAALCRAIGRSRSSLSIKTGCADCTETFP